MKVRCGSLEAQEDTSNSLEFVQGSLKFHLSSYTFSQVSPKTKKLSMYKVSNLTFQSFKSSSS